MVVTRKGSSSLSTPPPVSRTNSATASPRSRHKKMQPAHDTNTVSTAAAVGVAAPNDPKGPEFADPPKIIGGSPLKQLQAASISGSASSTPKPSPSRRTVAQRVPVTSQASDMRASPKGKKSSFLRKLRIGILLGLAGHSLLVCPQDDKLESPVCNTIHDFRTFFNHYVSEPYIQPRANEVLAIPAVSNVVTPVQEITSPFVQRLAPIVKSQGAQLQHLYIHYLDVGGAKIHHHTKPYVHQLQQHYDTQIHPLVDQHLLGPYKLYLEPAVYRLEGWGKTVGVHAEPYLYQCVVWTQQAGRHAQPYLLIAWAHLAEVPGILHRQAWEPLMGLRRTYVDPPLSKILETVNEATSDVKGSTATGFAATFMARAAETPVEGVADGKVAEEEGTSASEPFTSTDIGSTDTADSAAGITEEPVDQITFADASAAEVEDEDLEDFLRELGASIHEAEPEPAAAPEEPTQTPVPTPEAPKRATPEEIAAKRAHLVGQHANWEAKIDALSDEQAAKLPELLKELREAAVQELNAGNFVAQLEKEAERSLKNTEAFISKILAGPSTSESKIDRLTDLVGRVKIKFGEGATGVSEQIASWRMDMHQLEVQTVEKLVGEVHDLGLSAQTDLGLAYAWLEDVTVHDWTRYHDLLNAAKSLRTRLSAIADGSDQSPAENHLLTALFELQSDLQEVVNRFHSRLEGALERGRSAIRGHSPEKDTTDEPTFSILPVPEDLDRVEKSGEDALRHVVLQKTKEQVEDAVRMADEAAAKEAGSARVEL